MKQMGQKNRLNKSPDDGFTIVELLVVVVIIAVLAAISLVMYSGISQKAVASVLQSDLSNASTAIKAFQVENSNFPTTISTNCSASPDTNTNKCIKLSSGNSLVGYSVNNQSSPKTFLLIINNGSSAYKVTDKSSPSQLANTIQPGATPGADIEFHGAKANGGAGPGLNSPATATWSDISGNGNNGTLTNFGYTVSSGWTGTGTSIDPYRLMLDGTNDYLVLPDIGASEDKSFTFETWFKTSTQLADNSFLVSDFNSGTGTYTVLSLYQTYPFFRVVDEAWSTGQVDGSTSVTDGVWHHMVGTCDGSLMRLYVDGASQGTPVAPPAGTVSRTISYLGTYNTSLYHPEGGMAVARIYPFTLSAAQVTANYNAGPDW